MLRKFSSNAFGIADGTYLGRKIALVTVVILLTATVDLGARDGSREWVVLENCRLIMNPANDGDSFHASAGDKEYLFRLYLVDAPETDALAPRAFDRASEIFWDHCAAGNRSRRNGKGFHARETFSTVHSVYPYDRRDGPQQDGALLRVCAD